jgi:hypothetical protein
MRGTLSFLRDNQHLDLMCELGHICDPRRANRGGCKTLTYAEREENLASSPVNIWPNASMSAGVSGRGRAKLRNGGLVRCEY